MFRFFRQLRQHFLNQNLFSKYLMYATGEIVLVVIGILIALQVNTWNQERLSRAEEGKYLLRLEQDLREDLKRLQEVRENYEIRLILGLGMLDSLGNNYGKVVKEWSYYDKVLENSADSVRRSIRNMGSDLFFILVIDRFAPAQITFNELQNTGKISLIRDDSLRIELQYHYPKLEDILVFQESFIFDVQKTYREAMLANSISTLNQSDYPELLSRLSDPEQLKVAIENYLRISSAFLSTIFYNPDSHYNRTLKLHEHVQQQLNQS